MPYILMKVPVKDRSLRALAPEARTDLEGDLLKLKEESPPSSNSCQLVSIYMAMSD